MAAIVAAVALLALGAPAAADDNGSNGTTLNTGITVSSLRTSTHQWTITKTVSRSQLNMFRGDSGSVTYTIGATDTGTVEQAFLTGAVTVQNGGSVATQNLAIAVTARTTGSNAAVVGSVTLVPSPAVIQPGQTATYAYTVPVANPVAGADYKAVAAITITNHSGSLGTPSGPNPANDTIMTSQVQVINSSIHVDDSNGQTFPFTQSGTIAYPKTFACDADQGTHTNTATIRETGLSASASVTVSCFTLTVSASPQTQLTRTYTWGITKTAGASSVTLEPDGSSSPLGYTVSLTSTFADSNWKVSGTITVTDPAPIAAPLSSVTASLPSGSASVFCPASSVPAGGSLTCSFVSSVPSAASTTVTPTAALSNSPSGTTAFAGSAAPVDFSSAVVYKVDPTVTVTDASPATTQSFPNMTAGTITYTLAVGPYPKCGSYTFANKATFVAPTGQTNSATVSTPVTVKCYQLQIAPTASTSLTRTYTWSIKKSASLSSLTLEPVIGSTSLGYTVNLAATPSDSLWTASGSITVTNPAPVSASLGALVATAGTSGATLTCPQSLVIAAGSSVTCQWTAPLGSAASATLSANASLVDSSAFTASSYSGSKSFDFSSVVIVEIDKSVTVTDTLGGTTRSVGSETAGAIAPITYSSLIGPYPTCGPYTVTNTATFTTSTSHISGSDFVTTPVTVKCYQLQVAPTAQTSLTRTYSWSINKSTTTAGVTLDPGTATASIPYTVSLSSKGIDSGWAANGSITVTNPAPVSASLTGVVTTVGSTNGPATCQSLTIPAGGGTTCTWTTSLGSGVSTSVGATASLSDTSAFTGSSYAGSTAVDFSTAVLTEVDKTVSVSDTSPAGPQDLGTQTAGQTSPVAYSLKVGPYQACGRQTFTNTASFKSTTSGATGSSSVSTPITVTCQQLGIQGTSQPAYTNTYSWAIKKTASAASVTLDPGGTTSLGYSVALTSTPVASGWTASGIVIVSAPAPVGASISSVTAQASGGQSATLTCSSQTIAAGGSATCPWTLSLPSGSGTTVTFTATLGDTSDYTSSTYSGTATIDFSSAAVTEIDKTVTVTDSTGGPERNVGTETAGAITPIAYTETIGPYSACGPQSFVNTAMFTTVTGKTGSSSVTTPVTVTCAKLGVTDTATMAFTRTYRWTISKAASQSSLTLATGASANVGYTVTLGSTSTDSGWTASGNVAVTNQAPMAATLLSLSGQTTGGQVANVTCSSLSIPAGGSLTCPWTISRTSATATTLTFTATLANDAAFGAAAYQATAAIDFSAIQPSLVDDQVTVVDSSPAGKQTFTAAAGSASPITYTTQIGPYSTCGSYTFTNTATLKTNTTATTKTASVSLPVTVTCPAPVGCTFTIGYWKNHPSAIQPYLPLWLGTPGGAASVHVTSTSATKADGAVYYLSMAYTSSNGINKLYAQLLAAKLNQATGADVSAIQSTMDAADLFLATHNAASWSKLKASQQAQVLYWMSQLDNYNNGLIGPGHCTI